MAAEYAEDMLPVVREGGVAWDPDDFAPGDRTCDHAWAPPRPLPDDGTRCLRCQYVFVRPAWMRLLDELDWDEGRRPGVTVEAIRIYWEIWYLERLANKRFVTNHRASGLARRYQELFGLEVV